MLGKGDGLGPLQMGVPWHHRGLVPLGLAAEHLLQPQKQVHNFGDMGPDVHPQVQGHLVVAGAGGVEPFARFADPGGEKRLHIHVDVLVVGGKLDLSCLHIL